MFDYSKITEVNKGITYTDVRGKNYAEVAQRVQAFRKLLPGGFILPEIIKIEDGSVYMKAEAGYYAEDGRKVLLSVGHAFERQDASNINRTSYIENCETSAIGRALGFIGLGSEKSIASAEEVSHAIETQEAIEQGKIADPAKRRNAQKQDKQEQNAQKQDKQTPPATVNVKVVRELPQEKTPEKPPEPKKTGNPVLDYLADQRDELRKARKVSKAENNALWTKQIAVLIENKVIPDKALSTLTMQEAETLVNLMYTRFNPTGTELITDDGKDA